MIRSTIRTWHAWALAAAMTATGWLGSPNRCVADEPPTEELVWLTDYAEAMQQAERQKQMLLIHFIKGDAPAANDPLIQQIKKDADVRADVAEYVLLRLKLNEKVTVDGKAIELMGHPAFAEMERQPGIAIIDYVHEKADYYGRVVTCLPFKSGKYYHFRPEHLAKVLNLPAGTQTQRALVFAVRIHPEAPASAKGDLDPNLVAEAKQHSQYQASIRSQGHHHWEARFPRISRLLPFGLRPQEVVAESWPHEGMLDAAVDCVHSWRQSSGHWGAVRRDQPKFAYDMQRGSNGIWYATGIFGNWH